MYSYRKYFLLILLSVFLAAPILCVASTQEKIFYMSHSKEKEGIVSLQKNYDKIDILAPQFYGVSESLQLVGGLDATLKKTLRQAQGKNNNLKVMPLVSNAGFKQDVMHNLLVSKIAQDAVIKSLVIIAKKDGYIGWQFDFENINCLDKDLYSAFVEKTAVALHQNNLILSVAAVTRSVDYEDTDAFKNWSGAFDYARLAKAVDFISLMTYDDPNSVGPVASIPFVKSVLAYVKDKIPAEKLSMGIPLYYWGWQADNSKKVASAGTFQKLLDIMSNFRYNYGFSADLGGAWISYINNNKQYNIWYQNKQSFQDRLDIINKSNFRGFSAWVLGVEDPGIWTALDKTGSH